MLSIPGSLGFLRDRSAILSFLRFCLWVRLTILWAQMIDIKIPQRVFCFSSRYTIGFIGQMLSKNGLTFLPQNRFYWKDRANQHLKLCIRSHPLEGTIGSPNRVSEWYVICFEIYCINFQYLSTEWLSGAVLGPRNQLYIKF